jgi:hypothetical protein
MILTIPLYPGTTLSNVRYYWLVAGVPGVVQSSGITQPDPAFPLFRINATPPANAEEIVAYDITDALHWNRGQYWKIKA